MADETAAVDVKTSEIVSEFLLSTYRLQPTEDDVLAANAEGLVVRDTGGSHHETNPLLSGSRADMYIRTMLRCIGDIDIMFSSSHNLAIPIGYPSPTELPAEFGNRVCVFELIDTQYPGYVYLKLRYILTEMSQNGHFRTKMVRDGWFLHFSYIGDPRKVHGAAVTKWYEHLKVRLDQVLCVRCLSWPPQATDWPMRHRDHDWPDSATVSRVVSNGCDVVQVAHRLCRKDKWEKKYQWRLSFSRAEIVLMNNWTPKQQIVYHMLRAYVKANKITHSIKLKTISNYHIKTLMLWAVEKRSTDWWTGMNLVKLSSHMLNLLGIWRNDGRCRHYFLNKCNLFVHHTSAEAVANCLKSVTESQLSTWFVTNYIQECAKTCPVWVSQLLDDVSTVQQLRHAIAQIIDWRQNEEQEDLLGVFRFAEAHISIWVHDTLSTLHASNLTLHVRYYLHIMNTLAQLKMCRPICLYFAGMVFLHCHHQIIENGCSNKLVDVLSTVLGQFANRQRYSSQLSSELALREAVKLMKVIANNSRSTLQLIKIELSKAYLYRTFRGKASNNHAIYRLANLYLAVLYYSTGQYQTAIDHCPLVTRWISRVVTQESSPHIENIDCILGIRTAALDQQPLPPPSSTSTSEQLAYYVHFRCHRFTQPSASAKCTTCGYGANQELKFKENISTYPRRPPKQLTPTELNTLRLVDLLLQSAVEHLTTYRELQIRDFGSIVTFVTTDFEAMYAYKRGEYLDCLQLCTQNVDMLLRADRMYSVPVIPGDVIQLLDDDIVSLTGVILLVNRRSYDESYSITQLTLSLYLMSQCQLKLRHSATQLTQTLDYIRVAQPEPVHSLEQTLDQLTLKLAKHKAMSYMHSLQSQPSTSADPSLQTPDSYHQASSCTRRPVYYSSPIKGLVQFPSSEEDEEGMEIN